MGSFKLRLVIYFLLLSMLPLFAATWAFNQVALRGETGTSDSRLSTAIRVAQADYEQQIDEDAADTAQSLARATQVQRAFATHNRSALVRLGREVPRTAFYSRDGDLLAGEAPVPLAASRSADVITQEQKLLGTVVVHLPFDDELLALLETRSALGDGDRFVLAAGGRILAPSTIRDTLDLPGGGHAGYSDVNGVTYRAVSTDLVAADGVRDRPPVQLVALTPKSVIEDATNDLRQRFLFFALIAMLAVGVVAYALGRTIVRSLRELSDAAAAIARGRFERRVPVRGRDEFAVLGRAFNEMAAELETRIAELDAERGRVRDTITSFGQALAATHDPLALMPVIAANAVEATGAAGARVLVDGREIARAGSPGAGGRPLAIPLGDQDGDPAVLYLTPTSRDFGDESRELAHWLGSQASIALENARLHRLVERQASTDGLTELPNRRQFEEALEAEISRAERFGGGVALVVADLDDFKQVNDRHGHQAGDEVLRTFADILRRTVREIDLPARYGGEEFSVLLPQTDLEGAHNLAERLRRSLAGRPMTAGRGQLVAVTASFGVAAFPAAPTPAALFAAADEALYRAKRAGKNCVMAADAGTIVRAHD
ncbi:MAG TPA: diguanylate cyclase [Gaiellaceae bacterium]|nr:diguanylate cyclase [Gaiellaceae bacterium]